MLETIFKQQKLEWMLIVYYKFFYFIYIIVNLNFNHNQKIEKKNKNKNRAVCKNRESKILWTFGILWLVKFLEITIFTKNQIFLNIGQLNFISDLPNFECILFALKNVDFFTSGS